MGILRVNDREIDIYSSAYIFQADLESPHILGLKDMELERILGILGSSQALIANVAMIGDTEQVKYRLGIVPDQVLRENQIIKFNLLPATPFIDVRNIGLVNKMARQFMHSTQAIAQQ